MDFMQKMSAKPWRRAEVSLDLSDLLCVDEKLFNPSVYLRRKDRRVGKVCGWQRVSEPPSPQNCAKVIY